MSAGGAEPLLSGLSGQGFGLGKGSVPLPSRGPSFAPPSEPPSPFILSYGVSPAPPSGLEFRGLCFRSPKPWGPSMLVPAPGPFRALSFSPAVEASVFLLGSPVLRAHTPSVPSNSCPSPPPPPSLTCTCFLPYHSNVLILFLEALSIEGLIAT